MGYEETGNEHAGSDRDEDRSGTLTEYTPSSEDLVRQWHDLNRYYLDAKNSHDNGEIGSAVPAGLQKQLMSVQEQIRRAQEVEGKLYTREDIGVVLSRFAQVTYRTIREQVGEVEAAVIAGKIEQEVEKEVSK